MVLFSQQPNARPSGNDYSYRRMDAPHINGGLPQSNAVPTHLTNGYAENMMVNVRNYMLCYTVNVKDDQAEIVIQLQRGRGWLESPSGETSCGALVVKQDGLDT